MEELDSIRKIKEIIEERKGICIDQQRLLFQGKELKDERMITDYSLYGDCTIHFSKRMIGGGKKRKQKKKWREERSKIHIERKVEMEERIEEKKERRIQNIEKKKKNILPKNIKPLLYDLKIEHDFENFKFIGEERIEIQIIESTKRIKIHCKEIGISLVKYVSKGITIIPISISFDLKDDTVTFQFKNSLEIEKGELFIRFQGKKRFFSKLKKIKIN